MPIDRKQEDLQPGKTLEASTAGGILLLQRKQLAIPTETYLLATIHVSGVLTSVNPPQISYREDDDGKKTETNNLNEFLDNVTKQKNIAGIILVGKEEAGHYLGVNYNHKTNTLIITDPLGSQDSISNPYQEYTIKITDAFTQHLGATPNIYLNPEGTIYQGKTHGEDNVSCGIASNINVARFSNDEDELSEEWKKHIGITGDRLETNAQKARNFYQQCFIKDDLEEEKKRSAIKHQTQPHNTHAIDCMGTTDEITKLWQEREEELKKILTTHYPDNKNQPSHEIIKKYDILKSSEPTAIKARQAIYQYDQESDFGTKLAAEMLKAVEKNKGQNLDFTTKNLQSITINTGNRDLEFDVKLKSGRKEITIGPDTLEPGDNFTLSLAFQDKNGENMDLDGALYFQIQVKNGKIISSSHPELHKDEDGQYYAMHGKNRVYPKLDKKTIDSIQNLEKRQAALDTALQQDDTPDTKTPSAANKNEVATQTDTPKSPRKNPTSEVGVGDGDVRHSDVGAKSTKGAIDRAYGPYDAASAIKNQLQKSTYQKGKNTPSQPKLVTVEESIRQHNKRSGKSLTP